MQRPEQVGGHNHSGPLTANWGGEVLNVPNAITFGRLCAVPVAVWFVLQGRMGWALVLFVLAGVSDGVDGWLARRRGGTVLGAWMDPAADKALLVGMFVALASLMTGRAIPPTTAMTGEISLRGLVLPVGGVREKVIAAARAGITTVMLPARNRRDLDDIPPSAQARLRFVWLETVDDAVQAALTPDAEASS